MCLFLSVYLCLSVCVGVRSSVCAMGSLFVCFGMRLGTGDLACALARCLRVCGASPVRVHICMCVVCACMYVCVYACIYV